MCVCFSYMNSSKIFVQKGRWRMCPPLFRDHNLHACGRPRSKHHRLSRGGGGEGGMEEAWTGWQRTLFVCLFVLLNFLHDSVD